MICSSTQIAAIFGDQDISKCLYNTFLVIEQTNRLVLAIYNVTHVINNHAVLVELCVNSFVIRRSVNVYIIYLSYKMNW